MTAFDPLAILEQRRKLSYGDSYKPLSIKSSSSFKTSQDPFDVVARRREASAQQEQSRIEFQKQQQQEQVKISKPEDFQPQSQSDFFGGIKNFFKGAKENVKEGVESYLQGLANVNIGIFNGLGVLGDKVGQPKIDETMKKWEDKTVKILKAHPEWNAPTDMGKWDDPTYYVRGITGSLPSIFGAITVSVPVVVAGGGILATGATGFAFTSLVEGGLARKDAKDAGASKEQQEKAALIVGGVNGVLEILFPLKVLFRNPAGQTAKKSLVRVIGKNILQGMVLEGSTEASQEIVFNAVAKTYDKERELFDSVFESMVFGSIVGGGISALTTQLPDSGNLKSGFDLEGEPSKARNFVFENNLEDTALGKKILATSIEAEKKGQNIKVTGTKVELAEVQPVAPAPAPAPAPKPIEKPVVKPKPKQVTKPKPKKAVKISPAVQESVISIQEAISKGEIDAAKAIYKEIAKETGVPPFVELEAEVEKAQADEIRIAKKGIIEYGQHKRMARRMKRFLNIATEKKNKKTGELYREHIPENVFGISSDEIAADLGMSEGDFMASIAPEPAGAFFLKREPSNETIVDKLEPAKSPEELVDKIDQLNKFAQANAILRRTGGIKKKGAVGQFVLPGAKGVAKEGQVRLKGKFINSESDYVGVLAHELGHSIEFTITGTVNKNTMQVFGSNLSAETQATITEELKAITLELEGAVAVKKHSRYLHRPTELLARFFEKMIVSPGNLPEIAPTATDLIEKQAINHPLVAEFMEAAQENIDKGAPKFQFLGDLRQTYQKHLGMRVGSIAYGEEVSHRAMQERAKIIMTRFIKAKFKGIKDSPEALFRSAESIKISKGGQPEFGTRDFVLAKTEKELKEAKEVGFKQIDTQVEEGVAYPLLARQRYTVNEGKVLFDGLSKEGQQLVLDFTAERQDAKDYFNREIIKDVHGIEANIEGWVHHYFESDPTGATGRGLRFRTKKAGTRLKRKGKEGYVEDFQKAMTKVMVDLESEKVFNDFITRQFSRVTKPIPEGQSAEPGWVEVVGSIEKGVGLQQEKKLVVLKDDKMFKVKQTRYQMPKDIYERYKLWKGLVDEASTAVKIVADINRYWRINVLTHLGTAGTNMISGAIQYSTKVLTDFYTEVLTGQATMPKTRQNVSAMLKTVTPKGWANAPDWVYGADLSNFYGQFTEQPTTAKAISQYGDKTLKIFGLYERYWKKVVSTSENARDLKSLEKMTAEGLRLPTKEERELIAEINKEVDIYAYDYENVPVWLESHQKSALGQGIKPFAKYPYKYAKHFTNMAGAVFDGTLPWQTRVSKLLALATIMGMFALYYNKKREEQETPEGTETTPARLSTRGRLFLGKAEEGKEKFIRVAKYPFINLTTAGLLFVDRQWEAGKDVLADMVGSIGPIADLALLAFDYRSKYDQYKSVPAILGDNISTFVPGFRILNDVSRMLDPYQRKQTGFFQSITRLVPTTESDLQQKLHGDPRTVRVPIEGEIKRDVDTKAGRTTKDVTLKNYWQDILLSSLTGIYQTRIDPKEAEAFLIREKVNASEKETKQTIENRAVEFKSSDKSGQAVVERDLVREILGDPPFSQEQLRTRKSIIRKFREGIKE